MWNNLRARHYSVLILLAIVALETSAIAIDKFINRESETAFTIESPYQNNSFIESFKNAEASNAAVSVRITNTRKSTPAVAVIAQTGTPAKAVPEAKIRSVSAEFVAAANEKDTMKKYVEYSVQPGDSLSDIAVQFGSEADLIKKANRLEDKHTIKAGQTLKVPMPSNEMVYTVRRGDSLSKIANRFRVPLKTLIDENNLKSHMLMTDQRIRIPISLDNSNIKIVKEDTSTSSVKKLELLREDKVQIVPEKKLELIKLENLQMAKAPASKPKIEFIEKELLKTPPTLNKNAVVEAKPVVQTADTEKVAVTVATEPAPEPAEVTKSAAPSEKDNQVSYTVSNGDNLLKIAHRYNTTVAQIQQDNGMNGTLLKVGQELKVNPNRKLYRVVKTEKSVEEKSTKIVNHKVESGESLSLIARKYRTTISAIVAENNMTNTVVMAGQTINVPAQASYKVAQISSKAVRASWKMPVRGRLSDKYGWRKHPVYRKRLFHAGIDIAAPKGTPIAVAQNGKVIYAGRRAGYGNLVIVSHANGFSTRYAHCSKILVKKGQNVKAGQLVAKVGATGVATGNHLHFEIRRNGKTQNPLTLLN
ncbi:MAG: LysM peptidoglycan-binding domain-containing protein [Candidatus Riflebacteria bacterium]|nr:LysM peptidoglycan-binding domain-containing protein [Candidatus Riflebacteria bacterium]